MLVAKMTKLEQLGHRRARRILMNYSREKDLTRKLQLAWLDGYNVRATATPKKLQRLDPAAALPGRAKAGGITRTTRPRPKK
jgi:hypothetical protein